MRVQPPASCSKLWLAGPYVAIGVGLLVLNNIWVTVFGFHGVIAATLWIHRRQWSARRLWIGGSLAWIPALAVSVAVFGCGMVRLAAQFPGYGRHLRSLLWGMGLTGSAALPLAIYICLVNPILEEAFWRGLFFESHRRPALSDLAYGGVHVLIFWPFMLPVHALTTAVFLVGMGYLWRQIARRRNGLALSLAWHALGDVAILGAAGVILRGAGT